MRNNRNRAGLSLIWAMIVMTAMCGMASLAADYGRVQVAKMELLRAADAAARAAAGTLANGGTAAVNAAISIASQNLCDGTPVVVASTDVQIGYWDEFSRTFTPQNINSANANAARVVVSRTAAKGNALPLIFGKILGAKTCDVHSEAIAMVSPPYPGYVGIKLTRCFNTTNFDSYDSNLGPYSASNHSDKGVLIGVKDLWLHDNCTVRGEAHWGPTGSLTKDPGATCSPGPLTMKAWTQNYPPVNLGNVPSINDNAKLTPYFKSNTLNVPKGATVTYPGGTYYMTSITLGAGSTVFFSGATTIYLDGKANIEGNLSHTSYRPYLLKIKVAGTGGVHINAGNTYAYIYAPEGDVHSHQTGQNFGSVICSLLCWRQVAQGHYDTGAGPGGDIVSVK